MKSILQSLPLSPPLDRGHILLDFDVRCFPDEQRRTVAQEYGSGKINEGKNDDMYIVGKILPTDEYLVVPENLRWCTFGRKQAPGQKPQSDHVNHPSLTKILQGGNDE